MLDMKLNTIVGAVLIAVAFLTGWTMNGWRLNTRISTMEAQYEANAALANRIALEQYAALERRKQDAVDAAVQLAQQNAAAADAARAESDRLRKQLSANADRVPAASVASLREYTAALSTVFGECVAELESLAAKADGHALDSRTLADGWPEK